MALPEGTMRFNPTAVALQFNGSNQDTIDEFIEANGGGQASSRKPVVGDWVVLFMGEVKVLNNDQYRSAVGFM